MVHKNYPKSLAWSVSMLTLTIALLPGFLR